MAFSKRADSTLDPDPNCRIDGEEPDEVLCFFSGRRVPREDAVLVRLGPGQKVWMLRSFCRDG